MGWVPLCMFCTTNDLILMKERHNRKKLGLIMPEGILGIGRNVQDLQQENKYYTGCGETISLVYK